MREFLKQFLLYSRSERRAVVALAVLIVIVMIIPRAYRFYAARHTVLLTDTMLIRDMARMKDDYPDTMSAMPDTAKAGQIPGNGLFYFDPNTIGIDDWVRLGLTDKQAKSIEKYKSKGGRFKTADDLRRMYVLSDEMKDRLVQYVRIQGTGNTSNAYSSYSIEVNTADSAAFEALYGIGPIRSARIIRFRKLLGGFYRIEQVGETRGLPDSIFRLIRPHLTVDPALVTRIDINTADYETLRKHPYIHAKIAHAIIGYRTMNGKFENPDQLKTLKPITDSIFKKIQPYLKIQ